MDTLVLKRNSPYYKPYYAQVDNITLVEVSKIHFYDENGVVFSNEKGFFDEVYKNTPDELKVPCKKVRRANKLSFNKGDIFFMRGESHFNEKTVEVYIPMSLLENYTKEEHVQIYSTKFGESEESWLHGDKHSFKLGGVNIFLYDNKKWSYSEKYIKRHDIYKNEIGPNSIYACEQLLMYMKKNKISVDDLI